MFEYCWECENAYIDEQGNLYCDCIEDEDFGDCPYEYGGGDNNG